METDLQHLKNLAWEAFHNGLVDKGNKVIWQSTGYDLLKQVRLGEEQALFNKLDKQNKLIDSKRGINGR